MYGAIGRGIWNKEYWGEQSDDFQSNLFYNDTLKDLEKVARGHHPILQTIQNRERDAQDLSSRYSLTEDDDPDYTFGHSYTLEFIKRTCQENGADNEGANRLWAAIGWRENSDEIKKLEEELRETRNAMYRARKGESDEERETYTQNRQKSFEAENSLKSTKRHAIEKYTEWSWHKDYYDFRSDFETFLSDIVFHRRYLREQLYPDEQIKELIQKYLENPSWHVPQITDFLLTDLIDSDLIRLEEDFHLGLFSSDIANQLRGTNSFFSSLKEASPTLSPESKRKRSRWRTRNFLIGAGLIYFGIFLSGDEYLEPWISKDLLPWILKIISVFGFCLIVSVLTFGAILESELSDR